MRAGPRAEITAGPLDLSALPQSRVRRVGQFAREYLKVTRGKGARGPFRLRAWQKEIVSRLLPGSGVRPRQALLSLPRGNGKTSLDRRVGRARAVRRRPPKSSSPPMPGRRVSRCGKSPAWWSWSRGWPSRLRCSSRGCMCRTPTRPWLCCQGAWRVAGAETRASPLSTSCTSSAGRCGMPSSWRPGNGTRSLTLAISTPAPAREGVMWDLVEHGRRADDPSFVYVECAAPEGCEVDHE